MGRVRVRIRSHGGGTTKYTSYKTILVLNVDFVVRTIILILVRTIILILVQILVQILVRILADRSEM